jgi:hypothetical protein
MYDTIKLYLNFSKAVDMTPIDQLKEVQPKKGIDYRDEYGAYVDSDDYYKLPHPKGRGSWNIVAHTDAYVIEGSLAKWYFGNNVQTLTLAQAKKAVRDLGIALGVGDAIFKAKVNRVDFSSVVCTELTPVYYFNLMDYLNGFRRSLKDGETTLYYDRATRDKVVKAYDKTLEANHTGMEIPENYKGKNLFRFEVVYYSTEINRVFNKQKNLKEVTLKDILSERAFNHFADTWLDYYERIQKINNANNMIQKNKGETLTTRILVNRMVARLVNQTGLEDALRFIELDYQVGNVTDRRNINDAKRKVRELAQSVPAPPYDLIDDLDSRMRQRAREIKETIRQL